jgi:small subunit ribosomal protein S16
VSVRIRMKKMGRSHQHFFRICAIDRHAPNQGRVLEELGTYDPRVPDTDARAILKADRVDHWLSVGAEPSEKVAVLIKKYGTNGTRIDAQKAALDRLAQPKTVPDPGEPAVSSKPSKSQEAPAEEAAAAEPLEEEPTAVAVGAESESGAETEASSEE